MTAIPQTALKQFKLKKKIIMKFGSSQKGIEGLNKDTLVATTYTIPTIQSTVY